MKYLWVVFVVFLVACSGPSSVPEEKRCEVAEDCVKATCCHASDAVARGYGPDCTGMLCTTECVEGTLDCGQGEIACVENECMVVLK